MADIEHEIPISPGSRDDVDKVLDMVQDQNAHGNILKHYEFDEASTKVVLTFGPK